MSYKSYSRKKSTKKTSGIISAAAKTLFVLAAAVWFLSGFNRTPNGGFDTSVGAEQITVEMPVTENANVNKVQKDEFIPGDEDENGFAQPVCGVLTSSFGSRSGRRHTGIDIGADSGTDILAAAGGTVTFSGQMSGYGNYIIIDHGNGIETAYGHCSKLLAEKGENVRRGDKIALVGSTGNSTGPHLHFEIKINGEFVDPLDYVFY